MASEIIVVAVYSGIKEMGGIAGMVKVLRDHKAYGFKSVEAANRAIHSEMKRMGGDFFEHFDPSSAFGDKNYNKKHSDIRYSYAPSSEDNGASEERSATVFGSKKRQNLFGN